MAESDAVLGGAGGGKVAAKQKEGGKAGPGRSPGACGRSACLRHVLATEC